MCDRYALNLTSDQLVNAFSIDTDKAKLWTPSYSVATSSRAPIIREWRAQGRLTRNLVLAAWGYRPSWAKFGGPEPFNARVETVATSGLFRGSFVAQRCLVPMSPGYFEWVQVADGRQPYVIHNEGRVLAAAGLYATRKLGDAWYVSFTVLIRRAPDASGRVHERMPVFLGEDVWSDWLEPKRITDADRVLALLDRSSSTIARQLGTYPVARTVNNVRTVDPRDPAVIEPIAL
jgi:putative SOS response-associated peptidase YedK